jgi:hypothetical protein
VIERNLASSEIQRSRPWTASRPSGCGTAKPAL